MASDKSVESNSIEVVRGLRHRKQKHPDLYQNEPEDASKSLDMTATEGQQFTITGTPPFVPTRLSQVLEQERIAKHLQSKASSSLPKMSRERLEKNTQFGLGTNGDLNPSVESDNDNSSGSLLLRRPKKLNVSSRETRAGFRGRSLGSVNLNTPQKHNALRSALDDDASLNAKLPTSIASTHQSFMLPNIPNLTELVSGHRADETPLFSRTAKPQSRFIAPTKQPDLIKSGRHSSHSGIAAIPLPSDEKALYTALELLHDKVAALEVDKDNLEKRAEAYELEVLQLRSEVVQTSTCSQNNVISKKNSAKVEAWEQEKASFQTSIRALQRQQQKLTQQETELRSKIQRREKAIAQMSALTKELWSTRHGLCDLSITAPQISTAAVPRKSGNKTSKPNADTHQEQSQNLSTSRHTSSSKPALDEGPTEDAVGNFEESLIDITPKLRRRSSQKLHRPSKDADFLSFMDGDEISKLRQVVELDKAMFSRALADQTTVDSLAPTSKRSSLPRKSSLKKKSQFDTRELTDDISRDVSFTFNQLPSPDTTTNQDPSQKVVEITDMPKSMPSVETTQRSSQSRGSQRTRRQHSDKSSKRLDLDLTSSIILPDITLAGAALGLPNQVQSSKVTVKKPTPVTDRFPPAVSGEFDNTIRPGQDPGIALAMVVQSLEEELKGLRSQLADQETVYSQHDVSKSRRERKTTFARIQKLLRVIEVRSDQVYHLYDVLEGQKRSGQAMQVSEVEVTLENVGLDTANILEKDHAGHLTRVLPAKAPNVTVTDGDNGDNDDIDTDELPFEGFDTTASIEGRSN